MRRKFIKSNPCQILNSKEVLIIVFQRFFKRLEIILICYLKFKFILTKQIIIFYMKINYKL